MIDEQIARLERIAKETGEPSDWEALWHAKKRAGACDHKDASDSYMVMSYNSSLGVNQFLIFCKKCRACVMADVPEEVVLVRADDMGHFVGLRAPPGGWPTQGPVSAVNPGDLTPFVSYIPHSPDACPNRSACHDHLDAFLARRAVLENEHWSARYET